MDKYFEVVEVVRIRYKCNLPDIEGYTVKEYIKEYGMAEVFENSSCEEIVDYLEVKQDTIIEG